MGVFLLLGLLASLSHSDDVSKLWAHWYGEEGEVAKVAISRAAERDDAALQELMERYPDWAEPINRLATSLRSAEETKGGE